MKQKITDILHIIKEDGEDVSQRDLAQKAGFSLGNVNHLLKKCVKKGLIEMKRLSRRKVKYLLTPKGMKVVTHKTLNYVQHSYKIISNLQELMKKLTQEEYPDKEIYVLNDDNKKYQEVWELVRSDLNSLGKNYRVYNSIEELKKSNFNKDSVIFYWNPELENKLDKLDIDNMNIIRELNIGRN